MEGNLVTLDIGNSWIVIIKACKQKQSFDRHVDTRSAPITVSGGEIMLQMDAVADHVFRKKKINLTNKRKRGEEALTVWKKRSIFFTLRYWEDHVLRHNLDVMHIKNKG